MKKILIVGGSSGIGAATANLLALDHQIIATYHTHPQSDSHHITYHHYDVLSEDKPDFIPEILDGLVYCPGSISLKPLNRFSTQDFMQDYNLNVVGAVKTIQAALPSLKRSAHPSIVMFSTVAVQTGFPFHSMVSCSKGAIEGLTRALAAELAPKIRVNAIAPSLTDSPLAASLLSTEDKKEANAQRHPLKKLGTPHDMAQAVAYLLLPQSAWMTGQILKIDGGISTLKV